MTSQEPGRLDEGVALAAEITAHRYTVRVTLLHAVCLCPLMVLRSANWAERQWTDHDAVTRNSAIMTSSVQAEIVY